AVSTPSRLTPTGCDIAHVAAGWNHALALRANGLILSWGSNSDGQLGDGTNTDANLPRLVQMPLGTGTITPTAAGGHYHSLAVNSDGKVFAWGRNAEGQLGIGTTVPHSIPVEVTFPSPVTITQVAAGDCHSLALDSLGGVWSWGCDTKGQLGDDLSIFGVSSPVPIQTTGLDAFTQIAAGELFSLALRTDGTVFGWGANYNGQLTFSVPDTSPHPVPAQLSSTLANIVAISAGDDHAAALTASG